jgi:hypothetical protein
MDTYNLQKVILFVRNEYVLPENISRLKPEEIELILSLGCSYIGQANAGVYAMTNQEIIREMSRELTEKLREAERDVFFQKERVRLMELEQEDQLHKRISKTKDIFDSMLDTYRKDRDGMRERIQELEIELAKSREISRRDSTEMVQSEAIQLVRRELDSMTRILNEKEKQNDNYKELFERSMMKIDGLTQKRDVASIGKIGEGKFLELALSTFRDFEGFQIKDVCSIGGLGDFHLQFKDITILADSKLYSNKVNSTSREKIKRDLINNDHIQFAWLVSMDTYVDRFDKAPFMFEWVNSDKCVCYINCLQKQADPVELLRSVWFCCKAIHKMMTSEKSEKCEVGILKEREMRVKDILSKLVKNHRERDTILGQMRGNFERSDELVREMLNNETNDVAMNYYRVVIEWWNRNLVFDAEAQEKMKSNSLWTHFKRDLGDDLREMDYASFKEILCSFLGEEKVVRGKGKTGALEISGVAWKEKTREGEVET